MDKGLRLLLILTGLASCAPYESNLTSLGSRSSFSDVEIPDDFPAPEEDTPEVVETPLPMPIPEPGLPHLFKSL